MTYDTCKHPKCENRPRGYIRGLAASAQAYCSDNCRVDDVYGEGEAPIGEES